MKVCKDVFEQTKLNMLKIKNSDLHVNLTLPKKYSCKDEYYKVKSGNETNTESNLFNYVYNNSSFIDMDEVSYEIERDLRRYSNQV